MFVMQMRQMGMGAISQAENGETRVSQRGDVTVETLLVFRALALGPFCGHIYTTSWRLHCCQYLGC